MTAGNILELLQQKAPFEAAEPYDNCGLLVGEAHREVTAVLVTLDITHEAVDEALAIGAQLIVSHHPVIFEPLRALKAGSVPHRLAEQGLTAICAHTNLDRAVGGVNDCLCELLGLTAVRIGPDGMCRIGEFPRPMSAGEFGALVSDRLQTAVRLRAGTDAVRTVALCGGGAGDRVLPLLSEADAALTGEVKHHVWLAVPPAKTMADGGHYATEVPVTAQLARWIAEAFPMLSVTVHRGQAPYHMVKD